MMAQLQRKKRIRAKVKGTALRPRVLVFRSNKNLYLQAIDDEKRQTIASASTLKNPKEKLAQNLYIELEKQKIKKIVFDRGGYKYHGKVKTIAEDLRKLGLEF